MYQSVVVGLTPGGWSDAPARYALALAERTHLHLHGFTAIDPARLTPAEAVPPGGAAYKARRDEAMLATVREAAGATLAQFADQAKAIEVPCEVSLQEGDLPKLLAAAAERADVLVIGHGAGRSVAGEVAHLHVLHGILARCARPVLVAAPDAPPTDTALIVYDGTPHATRALQAFAGSGWYATYAVHLLTIHGDPATGEQVAQRAVDYLRAYDIVPRLHRETPGPDAAQQILTRARRIQASLVVTGADGHSRLRTLLLGSTTHAILDAGQVSVLLAH
ncbi:MAG TPA: universal stress protein [Candidatus Sulfotelmatobacter sp.]|nr:universal stress protein [Candidatus Sulfotelmatobacter sp.]